MTVGTEKTPSPASKTNEKTAFISDPARDTAKKPSINESTNQSTDMTSQRAAINGQHVNSDPAHSLNNDTVHYLEDGNLEDPQDAPTPKARIAREVYRNGEALWVDELDFTGHTKEACNLDNYDVGIYDSGDIILWHPFLLNVVRQAVKFFPGFRMSGDHIYIEKPHMPIFHYWDEMCGVAEKSEDKDKGVFEQLKKVVAKWILPGHEIIRQQIREGLIECDCLWALFCPGDLIMSKDRFDQPVLHVYTKIEERGAKDDKEEDLGLFGGLMMSSRASGSRRWCFDAWSVTWDTSTREFGRQVKCFTVDHFNATKAIASLDAYPLKFHAEYVDGAHPLIVSLEKRGREWKSLVSGKSACRKHKGPTFEIQVGVFQDIEERTNLDDRVVCDHNGYYEYGNEDEGIVQAKSTVQPMLGMMNSMLNKGDRPITEIGFDSRYDHYDGKSSSEEFSSHQAMLCPSAINVICMTTKKWYQVSIANLSPVVWSNTAIDSLVMEEKRKNMLKSLVAQHSKNNGKVIDDFIVGKGKGLVLVLHGPPGVGKTLTAESIAEATMKPLYPINIGEMSVGKDVEKRLTKIFKQASAWDAVLLLDEADVVLEARSFENSKRNGTVSVFLRKLEYYEGILIMTTNRMGIIDVAFQSRIHMAVKYDPLDASLRAEVWRKFISNIKHERDAKVKKELLERVDELAERPLNGRQIRNVLGIAQSMALSDPGSRKLTFERVEEVLEQTLDFQEYFEMNQITQGANLGQINPQWGKKGERRR